jgi:hypothetical protein
MNFFSLINAYNIITESFEILFKKVEILYYVILTQLIGKVCRDSIFFVSHKTKKSTSLNW